MAYRGGNSGLHAARAGNKYGATPFFITQQTSSGTSSYDVVDGARFKFRVLDVMCIATAAGGAGDTITVKNGSDAISDDIDLNDSDKTVSRASTIDDAYWDIPVGGTLNITTASGAVAYVVITCVRI